MLAHHFPVIADLLGTIQSLAVLAINCLVKYCLQRTTTYPLQPAFDLLSAFLSKGPQSIPSLQHSDPNREHIGHSQHQLILPYWAFDHLIILQLDRSNQLTLQLQARWLPSSASFYKSRFEHSAAQSMQLSSFSCVHFLALLFLS